MKIVMVAGVGRSSTYMYNGLSKNYTISTVFIEKKVDSKSFIKRRIKRLGMIEVVGQLVFQICIPKILSQLSKGRITQIKSQFVLDDSSIPGDKIVNVESVNSADCIELLRKENPDLVIVNGTRIISKDVLTSTSAVFLNTHAGITPKYRGVHGGYWALANQDPQNCGVTVHLVDTGIDTGGIIYQEKIHPSAKDNFATYTYLQTGVGINLMKLAIRDFLAGELKTKPSQTPESKLWYHPTIWKYLFLLITKRIK